MASPGRSPPIWNRTSSLFARRQATARNSPWFPAPAFTKPSPPSRRAHLKRQPNAPNPAGLAAIHIVRCRLARVGAAILPGSYRPAAHSMSGELKQSSPYALETLPRKGHVRHIRFGGASRAPGYEGRHWRAPDLTLQVCPGPRWCLNLHAGTERGYSSKEPARPEDPPGRSRKTFAEARPHGAKSAPPLVQCSLVVS